MLTLFSLAAILVPGALSQATVLGFDWDCTNSLMTCNNACYLLYVYRLRVDTLTYGADIDQDTKRMESGCSRNPCNDPSLSYGESGESCDEYPFASVNEGGPGASLRCTPMSDQSSEGGQLEAFYKSFGHKDGQAFNVFITNYAGAPFCDGSATTNDGFQFRLENDNFNTYKRDLKDLGKSDPNEAGFVDLEPRNATLPRRRIFEDEEGSRHLLLGSGEAGQTFEGMDLFSEERWKKILCEIHDE